VAALLATVADLLPQNRILPSLRVWYYYDRSLPSRGARGSLFSRIMHAHSGYSLSRAESGLLLTFFLERVVDLWIGD